MAQLNQPAPREGVEDHHCLKADDFLNVLSPRYSPFWQGSAYRWIFRGQADAEWDLKARWVRAVDVFERYGVLPIPKSDRRFQGQGTFWGRNREYQERLLRLFRAGLDRSGLVIPAMSPRLGYHEENLISSGYSPSQEVLPLLALAQHHGLPTMFLDWTRRAWVAAYFAAAEAATKPEAATHLATWALDRPGNPNAVRDLYFYDAPGGTNPNLRAQAGLFTYHIDGEALSLEQHLVRVKASGEGEVPRIRRITLPRTEAQRLLRLLFDEGIDAASMFPGPDGVVLSMRERALWDEPGTLGR